MVEIIPYIRNPNRSIPSDALSDINKGIPQESNWILPPGLLETLWAFEAFYKTVYGTPSKIRNPPLIISGPRGSGKTLLRDFFISLYRKDHPEVKRDQVVLLNVAAIPPTLIESELFGYVKGAFTHAVGDIEEFVEKAQKGILILEEIGEIDKSLQSKLLTFIEDHLYYKVGDRTPHYADTIQIVATTNKSLTSESFREDFLDRCYSFSVPPLHKRRMDILYYLHDLFPELVASLRPSEVLTLMAYNWPGNVRELERMGQRLRMEEEFCRSSRRFHLFGTWGSLEFFGMEAKALFEKLTLSGVNVGVIEKSLNQYGLGLRSNDDERAFRSPIKILTLAEESNRYNLQCYRIEAFDNAYQGLKKFFCPLFSLDVMWDNNLLNLQVEKEIYPFIEMSFEMGWKKKHIKIYRQVSQFLEGENSQGVATTPQTSTIDICNMREKELLQHYFRSLMEQEHGSKAAVARRAGIHPKSIYRILKSLGINDSLK